MPLPNKPGFQNAYDTLIAITEQVPAYAYKTKVKIESGPVSLVVIKDCWIFMERNRVLLQALIDRPGFAGYIESQFSPGDLDSSASVMLNEAITEIISVRDAAKNTVPVDANGYILSEKFDDANGTIVNDDTSLIDTTALLNALNSLLVWAQGA